MKTGITASSYFPHYGEDKGLLRIREDGFDAIDYGLADYRHPAYLMPEAEALTWAEEFSRKVERAGLTVSQLHGPWRWPPRDASDADLAEVFEHAKRALLIAHALGSPYMVIHPLMPFGDSADPDPETTRRVNSEFFRALLPFAEKAGVAVCLENVPMPALSIASAASVNAFAEEIGSPYLKLCLDTGHALVTGENPADCVRLFGERLACLHLHDNHGQRDEHLWPGDGSIDRDAFAASLRANGFRGVLSLETGVVGEFADEEERKSAEKALYNRIADIAKKAELREAMMAYYLAIDIGASSGRHIVGWKDENGELVTEEVFRFPNSVVSRGGHLNWDIESLEANVREGIDKALERFGAIESLSIDTWGVDYVLLNGDEPILPCYAYRDSRTEEPIEALHAIVPFEELYAHTGIQFQPFNTVYQLYTDKLAGRLDGATDFLLMPEYLMWRLSGEKSHEYTNATTGGLVNALTKEYDFELIDKLGLPKRLFKPLQQPGTVIGRYKDINVVLCATHDTGSAVAGIPMPEEAMFLSSGTWSLLGAKIAAPITSEASLRANFTNEGGVGYIRYLKNIMGLWITQNLKKELGIDFKEMEALSRESSYDKLFDANDGRFMAPENMKAEILAALGEQDLENADLFRTVYRSLAECYRRAIGEMEALIGKSFDELYIVGGGAKNGFLNEQTESFTGKKVIALPIEATAIGNLIIQMEASK